MNRKHRIIGAISLLLVVIILGTLLWPGAFETSEVPDHVLPPEPPEPTVLYGINVDSCLVIQEKVKRNQSLSDILTQFGVGPSAVHELAQLSRAQFDVRRIKAGNPYTLIMEEDSLRRLLYFIYEENHSDHVIFCLKDTLWVTRGAKPIAKDLVAATGTIESSLWNALVHRDDDPNLANELSEVYAWTIDFFGIQKGDAYKVIYEEMSVEGKSIGIGKVMAAHFQHYGKDFYAFRFEDDGQAGYYDENGENLQRAFLKAPLKFKRISSKFSHSRLHPVLKIRRPHHGIDYAANYGTPVYSIGEGVVTHKGWDPKGGGNYVKIKHNSTYSTAYLHLSGFAKGLSTGSRVSQGQLIGYVGSTGMSTGPHLDFRFYRNGQPVDPLKVESPPSEPVHGDLLPAYLQMAGSMKMWLDSLQVE